MVPRERSVEAGESAAGIPSGITVEVCVEGPAGLRAARAGGARRVELCSALALGGLTPSAAALEACLADGGIEVGVLVRPRTGDFVYSESELALLEREIELVRERGASGVALGCLRADGALDLESAARLIARARPMTVTFHRAFDLAREPERALEELVELGVERVLSSGGAPTAHEGRARLAALVAQARGRIAVVAAGGVRADHARELVRTTGVREVHLSAAARVPSSMRVAVPCIPLGRAHELDEHWGTDEAAVRALVAALRG